MKRRSFNDCVTPGYEAQRIMEDIMSASGSRLLRDESAPEQASAVTDDLPEASGEHRGHARPHSICGSNLELRTNATDVRHQTVPEPS